MEFANIREILNKTNEEVVEEKEKSFDVELEMLNRILGHTSRMILEDMLNDNRIDKEVINFYKDEWETFKNKMTNTYLKNNVYFKDKKEGK